MSIKIIVKAIVKIAKIFIIFGELSVSSDIENSIQKPTKSDA
jgi:hypothetical protein